MASGLGRRGPGRIHLCWVAGGGVGEFVGVVGRLARSVREALELPPGGLSIVTVKGAAELLERLLERDVEIVAIRRVWYAPWKRRAVRLWAVSSL